MLTFESLVLQAHRLFDSEGLVDVAIAPYIDHGWLARSAV